MYVYSTGEKAYIGNKSDTKPPGQSGDVLVEVDKDLDVRRVYKYDGSSWVLKNTVDNHGSINDDVQGSSELEGVYTQLGEKTHLKANTFVLFGDSITEANKLIIGTNPDIYYFNDDGYFRFANAILGGYLKILNYAGIGGNTTTQMLGRIETDVIAYKPAFCMIMGGVNDLGADLLATDIFERLTTMYEMLIAEEITPVISTVNPSTAFNTTSRRDEYFKLNRLIKNYAIDNPKVIFADMASTIIDPTQAYPYPKTGYTRDGIVHPCAKGALNMGKELAKALEPYVKYVDVFENSPASPIALNPNTNQTGTTGTKAGGATGTVSDNVAIYTAGTSVCSKVARFDNKTGELLKIVATTTSIAVQQLSISTGFVAGDTIRGVCEYFTDNDWTNLREVRTTIEFYNGATKLLTAYGMYHWYDVDTADNYSGISLTPEVNVPDGTTSINLILSCNDADFSGTFYTGRMELQNLSNV